MRRFSFGTRAVRDDWLAALLLLLLLLPLLLLRLLNEAHVGVSRGDNEAQDDKVACCGRRLAPHPLTRPDCDCVLPLEHIGGWEYSGLMGRGEEGFHCGTHL